MFKKIALTLAIASGIAGAAAPASAQVYVGFRLGAPPPPRYEVVPVAPGPGYYWRQGYWYVSGGRYVWHRGYYIRRPYAGARWVPDRWDRGPHGYYRHEGYWRR